MKHVLIGIQCRSTSERLPGKAMMKIGRESIIQKIVRTAKSAAKYVNHLPRYNVSCRVVLLVPTGDKALIDHMRGRVEIFEGQEHDVLSRYYQALRSYRSDYIVRVTGDCYYLPSHTIARHIKRVLKHPADYVNNVLERCIPEGFDCELISQQLLVWLHENAKTASEREHVTSLIPKKIEEGVFPQKFKICTATDQLDFSHLKTSIDTAEDYERACQEFETRKKKYENSIRIGSVF